MVPTALVLECIDQFKGDTYLAPQASKDLPAVKSILALDRKAQVLVVREFLDRLDVTPDAHFVDARLGGLSGHYFRTVLGRVLQRELPFELADILLFFEKLRLFEGGYSTGTLPVQAILRAVKRFIDRNGTQPELDAALKDFRRQLAVGHYVPNIGARSIYAPTAAEKSLIEFIDDLSGNSGTPSAPPITLSTTEPWAAGNSGVAR
jgi:hypothetical protein